MALMSYPGIPVISYKGFGGYISEEDCESRRIIIENHIIEQEINRNRTVYIKSFCMEMDTFEDSLRDSFKNPKLNEIKA